MHTSPPSCRYRLAVTGMALVNALGNTVAEVWKNSRAMRSGLCLTKILPDDPPSFVAPDNFVPGVNTYCGVIGHADFSCTRQDLDLPPQDFRAMSTSTRLSLLLAKQVMAASGLVDAGYEAQRIGVFVSQNSGEAASTLWDVNLTLRAGWLSALAAEVGDWGPEQQQAFQQRLIQGRVSPDESTMLCRLNCTAAGLICQRYGFSGPSFSVGAACSSSLAALYTAHTLIQAGVIDAAVVGGGEEGNAPLYFAEFSAIGALARPSEHITTPETYSRPFDLYRNGFVLGEGGVMLTLEREDKARQRNAPVHGLITNVSSVTNTTGLIEPSAHFQAQAIRQSFAGLEYGPEAVDLVECHATSTPLGDLAEAQSLVECFGHKKSPTVLSAYKGQIGHTTGASGLISLIHGLCAMQDGIFPGTLNCDHPDPALKLDSARLRVPSSPEIWPCPETGVRRMQVNTFGFGGSCFVAQVEEANDRQPRIQVSVPPQSAGSQDNAKPEYAKPEFEKPEFQGQEHLVDGTRLISLPHQGQVWRLGATTPLWLNELATLPPKPSPADLVALSRRGVWLSPPEASQTKVPAVAVMCCGQGSVWPGMGRALYDTFPTAREAMDRIAKVADWDILSLMDEPSLDKIILTRWQQPYLFLLEYAQAHYLTTLGLKPTVMSGHSLGELIALCLAGVYSPETAWTILDTRSRHMAQLEEEADNETGMMSVHCTPQVLDESLKEWPELHVSNYNSPMQVILSGPRPLLQEVRRTLRKRRIPAILLNVSLAFHHPHMRALRDVSLNRLMRLDFNPPLLPMMSNITTGLYPNTKDEIVSYIADLDENSVRWVEVVRNMWNKYTIRHFVEVGPGDTLCGLVSDIESEAVCVAASRKDKEVEAMRTAVARLYALGHLPQRAGQGARGNVSGNTSLRPAPQTAANPAQFTTTIDKTSPAAPQRYEAHIEKVMPIIAQATGYTREELQADMDLRHDLAIRSSRFPLIMHEAENQFQIKLRFEDMLGVSTIRDLAEVLRKLQQGAQQDATKDEEEENSLAGPRKGADSALASPLPPPSPLPVIRYAPGLQTLAISADAAPAPVSATHILVVGSPEDTAPHNAALKLLYPDAQTHCCTDTDQARHWLHEASAQPALTVGRGLLLVLPAPKDHADAPANALTENSAITPDPTAARLGEAFALLKDFCTGKGASFCVALQQQNAGHTIEHGLEENPLLAGLNGLFLAAALEYPGCVFRTVRLGINPPPLWLAHLLTPALPGKDASPRPLQWICADHACQSPQLQVQALDPALPGMALSVPALPGMALPVHRGDIILVSGGARGISPHLLTALGPWACTFVLLGRSATSGAHSPDSGSPLAALSAMGSVVEHMCCDVSDAAAVQEAVREVVQRHGRVDGLIHAAGITRDATLDALDSKDFDEVLRVKYQGLQHCLEACRPAGLRYALALSSLAAWLGNYGQANYCAANRAMTALLHGYCRQHGIASRGLWLPPVLGAGMAASEQMQEQMRLRGLEQACLHYDELGDLLARELFCGTGQDILWARLVPAVPHVSPPALQQGKAAVSSVSHAVAPALPMPARGMSRCQQNGLYERPQRFPLVFPLRPYLADPQEGLGTPPSRGTVFEGIFYASRYADHWLGAPELPLLAKLPLPIVLDCLTQTALLHCPWLQVLGLRHIRPHQPLYCQGGITREAILHSHSLPWDTKSASIYRICNTTMQVHGLAPNGRKQASLSLVCQGDVLLAAQNERPVPLWEASGTALAVEIADTVLGDHEHLREYCADFVQPASQNPEGFAVPAHLLEAFMLKANDACIAYGLTKIRLEGIDEIRFFAPPLPEQTLRLHLRARWERASATVHVDGQFSDTQGLIWLTVHNCAFTQEIL